MASIRAEPNIVPLCDVLLVLLVIFMIITPLLQRGLNTGLERSDGIEPSQSILVTLKPGNKVLLNDEEVEIGKFQDRLRSLFVDRKYRSIYFRAYASVPFQKVAELLGLIKGVGTDYLNLVPEYIEDDNH